MEKRRLQWNVSLREIRVKCLYESLIGTQTEFRTTDTSLGRDRGVTVSLRSPPTVPKNHQHTFWDTQCVGASSFIYSACLSEQLRKKVTWKPIFNFCAEPALYRSSNLTLTCLPSKDFALIDTLLDCFNLPHESCLKYQNLRFLGLWSVSSAHTYVWFHPFFYRFSRPISVRSKAQAVCQRPLLRIWQGRERGRKSEIEILNLEAAGEGEGGKKFPVFFFQYQGKGQLGSKQNWKLRRIEKERKESK